MINLIVYAQLVNYAVATKCFLSTATAHVTNLRAGATLFYFATGGLHPYGDTGDPELVPRIIGDRKVHFDKVRALLPVLLA